MAKRWYTVSVLSNFEKKIAEQIRTKVAEQGLEEQIDEVLVPTEEVIEVRRGKRFRPSAGSCRAMFWCTWRCPTRATI
jgi:transcription antitermination factor NusG